SVGYRLRKFVWRNRGPVAASVARSLVLIAGVGSVMAVQARARRERAAAAERATRRAPTDASNPAAVRRAPGRGGGGRGVIDYPDRMQRATDAAVAAVRRADEFAEGGLPGEATRAGLESTRRAVGDLARHTRLIVAYAGNKQKYAEERGAVGLNASAN